MLIPAPLRFPVLFAAMWFRYALNRLAPSPARDAAYSSAAYAYCDAVLAN